MEGDTEPDPLRTWQGQFGQAYTARNRDETASDVDEEYQRAFGTSKSALYERFFSGLEKDARILEVGCNVGVQLDLLAELGFENCVGIDVQRGALVEPRHQKSGRGLVQADGRLLPFADASFDCVFTVGVLIHIPPAQIDGVMDEITRCSREYVYGCEYYAPEYVETVFRGETGVMWKNDFADRYRRERNLALVDDVTLAYQGDDPYTVTDQFVSAFLLGQGSQE
ncbi:pseudaminic acid biosynthesis-associated methylase [Natrialbaceae archaeon A-CW3]